jgi:hypothetical protein
MAHLGDANEATTFTPEEIATEPAKQFEGDIAPYIISGQLFPRNTP